MTLRSTDWSTGGGSSTAGGPTRCLIQLLERMRAGLSPVRPAGIERGTSFGGSSQLIHNVREEAITRAQLAQGLHQELGLRFPWAQRQGGASGDKLALPLQEVDQPLGCTQRVNISSRGAFLTRQTRVDRRTVSSKPMIFSLVIEELLDERLPHLAVVHPLPQAGRDGVAGVGIREHSAASATAACHPRAAGRAMWRRSSGSAQPFGEPRKDERPSTGSPHGPAPSPLRRPSRASSWKWRG